MKVSHVVRMLVIPWNRRENEVSVEASSGWESI
jgi:hypothetical protein